MSTINIDGTEYEIAALSDEVKNQVINLQACDAKLKQLQQEAAITQTARNTYALALKEKLPKA